MSRREELENLIFDWENKKQELSSIKEHVFSVGKTIFDKVLELDLEYRKKYPSFELIKFASYSKPDNYSIDKNNNLVINYYDCGYDCYDCSKLIIPMNAIESDETIEKWFKEITDKFEEDKKKSKKDKEKTEYEQYLKLKEKYEKDNIEEDCCPFCGGTLDDGGCCSECGYGRR